jgi:hypothetical protein
MVHNDPRYHTCPKDLLHSPVNGTDQEKNVNRLLLKLNDRFDTQCFELIEFISHGPRYFSPVIGNRKENSKWIVGHAPE